MYSISADDISSDQLIGYSEGILSMAKALNFDLEQKDLFEFNDLNYLSKKVKNISDDLERSKIRTLLNKIDNIENCNKFWDIDKFIQHKQKWVKKQNLCHDKFCSNCKKVKQSARMEKYIPVLQEVKDNLYHLTLTVPNVKGEELEGAIKIMSKCFKRLINFISGYKKIKDIDFKEWGYLGAVRSLEITYKENNTYHPHFHVGLVMNGNFLSKKNIQNKYSFDYKTGITELKRLFCKEEILIQKIWFLLIHEIRVNKKNIDDLEDGFSCIVDKFPEDDFAELFKYMTKDKDEEGNILTYDNFKTLYEALYRVKQIQGYGVLYQISDSIDLDKYEEKYQSYIEELIKKESPVYVRQTPQELHSDSQYKLLNKSSYIKYLKQL